jgi:ATP-dependent DNA helicase RecQ
MDLLVVDECHCLSEWGEVFRPAFADIPDLIERYQVPRSLWLTATLPPDDLKNLKARLPEGATHSGGFELPRELYLSFIKIPLSHRPSQLLDFLTHENRPGVVFTTSRAMAEKVSRLIEMTGRKSIFYHAGLSTEERQNKEHVISEHSPIVVATSAFGMGVHYPQLRWALCYHAPSSPLSLAQSLGRAGRQGSDIQESEPPRAIVFWDEDDFRLIEWVAGNSERKKAALMATRRILNTVGCRRVALQAYFDTAKSPSFSQTLCQNCDFCSRLSN